MSMNVVKVNMLFIKICQFFFISSITGTSIVLHIGSDTSLLASIFQLPSYWKVACDIVNEIQK